MKKRIILDLIFYLAVPLLTWNFFRGHLGDYLTILFGMVPAVVYTVVTFIWNREWNVTGIFFLFLISLNFIMNIISHTAEQELWNGVTMSIISIIFYLITIIIKRPMGIFFFIDYAFAKGIPRQQSKQLYYNPKNFHHFNKFTLFLCFREVLTGAIKSIMILKMGVNGFNSIQITGSVINYLFSAIMIFYIIYIIKQTSQRTPAPEATT